VLVAVLGVVVPRSPARRRDALRGAGDPHASASLTPSMSTPAAAPSRRSVPTVQLGYALGKHGRPRPHISPLARTPPDPTGKAPTAYVLVRGRFRGAPSAGFEPAHPPPEGGALSPELRGLGRAVWAAGEAAWYHRQAPDSSPFGSGRTARSAPHPQARTPVLCSADPVKGLARPPPTRAPSRRRQGARCPQSAC
jgi:hypothetical protein